jgi:phage/plasmid-associated DNA primase
MDDLVGDKPLIDRHMGQLREHFKQNYLNTSTTVKPRPAAGMPHEGLQNWLARTTGTEAELDDYLSAAKFVDVTGKANIHEWWKVTGLKWWPNVAKMARDILSIPGEQT